MEDNSTDVPDKAQLQDKSGKAYSPVEAYFSSYAKMADEFPYGTFLPWSSTKYLVDMCLQDSVHIASLTGNTNKLRINDFLQTDSVDTFPQAGQNNGVEQNARNIDKLQSDIADIKNKQVTEDKLRAIVRQEIDRVRSRKPAKRRPPLTQNAIRLAFEMWSRYRLAPAAVRCSNGRKVTYADVYEKFRSRFESCGINDLEDFKRAIESSRKSMSGEWKKLPKRRSRAR